MDPLKRAGALAAPAFLLLLAVWACVDGGLFSPAPFVSRRVPVGIRPFFAAAPAGTNPAGQVDNLRIRFSRSDSAMAKDTTASWPAERDTIEVEVVLELQAEVEVFRLVLEARAGDDVVFRVVENEVRVDGRAGAAPPVLSTRLEYVGPGAAARSLRIEGAPGRMLAGASARLTAVPRDGGGSVPADAPVAWESLDTLAARVDADGVVTGGRAVDRTARIAARVLYTTAADTVRFPLAPAGVVVEPTSAVLRAVGQTATLSASAVAEGGAAVTGAGFEWQALDPGVVELETTSGASARVVARGGGTGRVLARSGDVADTAAVEVRQTADRVEVSPPSSTLTSLEQTVQLEAAVRDAGGVAVPGAEVTWSTSDAVVATVSGAGLVTAAGNGRATIMATSGGVSGAAEVEVQQAAARVEVSPAAPTLASLGETVQLVAAVRDAGGSAVPDAAVTWSSSAPALASVDAAGRVTAVSNGAATITAASGGASGSASVTVRQQATTLALSPASVAFTALGETRQLEATARDARGNAVA